MVPVPTPNKVVLAPLKLWETFMCGGLAGCAAVTICTLAYSRSVLLCPMILRCQGHQLYLDHALEPLRRGARINHGIERNRIVR